MENYFDRSKPVPARGPIQLQTHGGEIRWRNVFLREIGAEEGNRWLDDHESKRIIASENSRWSDISPGWALWCANCPTDASSDVAGARLNTFPRQQQRFWRSIWRIGPNWTLPRRALSTLRNRAN